MDVILEFKVTVKTVGDKPKDSETLISVDNQIKLAYLLAESHLPVAESRFQKAWESTIAEPVQIQFADAVNKLFQLKHEKEIALAHTPELPKPAEMFLETVGADKKNEEEDG